MNDLFASVYEGWGIFWLGEFSNDLYSNNLYLPVALTLLISSLIWMVVYYYVIDHPRFARAWHWLIWMLALCAINFGAANYITFSRLTELYTSLERDLPYYSEFTTFSFINALWTFIFAFIVSLLIKGRSVMCKRTPF